MFAILTSFVSIRLNYTVYNKVVIRDYINKYNVFP